MSQRRKLVIEKVIDSEIIILRPPEIPSRVSNEELTKAERFVFDDHDVKLVMNDSTLANLGLNKPPYDHMWVEIQLSPMHKNEFDRVNQNNRFGLKVPPEVATESMWVYGYFSKSLGVIIAFQITKNGLLEIGFCDFKELTTNVTSGLPALTGMPQEACELAVEGTVRHMLGALALLTIQGDVIREDITLDVKLASARAKRGKAPLKNYTYIHLNHTVSDTSTSPHERGNRAAHLVRGHFKARKTGTFWWRPHIAGVGEIKKRDAYIVKP